MIKLTKVLLPTDFSGHSLSALPYALEMCRLFGAELHCLHVVDEAYQHVLGSGDFMGSEVMMLDDLWEPSLKRLEQFVAEHITGQAEKVITHQVAGRPFVEIIRYAQEKGMDMMVIATHGHSGLTSMLLGSVTEKVVRKSPCPVLTVRTPGHEFKMP